MTTEKKANKDDKPTTKPSIKNSSPSKKTKPWILVALLIALIAITAVYNIKNNQNLKQTIQTNKNLLAKNQQNYQILQQSINKLETEIDSINKQKIKLQHAQEKLTASWTKQFYQTNDWQLLKARHYLELADLYNEWHASPDTIVDLLNKAKDSLASLPQSEVANICDMINQTIAKSTPKSTPDTSYSLERLSLMGEKIAELPTKQPIYFGQPEKNTNDVVHWQDSLHLLEKLVVIRHHAMPYKPMPSYAEQLLIVERIKLYIQFAQWALIQKDESLYQSSIQKIVATIQENYDVKAQTTQRVIDDFEKLAKRPVESQIFSIKPALDLINQVIQKSNENTSPQNNGQEESA